MFIKNLLNHLLLLNMVPSLFLRMLLVATVTVALFIIMSMADAYEARRILHGHALPSTFNPKAMEYSQSRQYPPPHVPVPPSAPNPSTHIPSSSWRQTKNLPRPYMLHGAYYQGTHIPAASTASTTTPMLGTP